MTDRERFGPSLDEIRIPLIRIATANGTAFVFALLDRVAGIHRLSEAERLSVQQRFRLLEELQLADELLS